MKNILLSVMVICTLIGGALAGTLADFSDIEVSPDNYIKTGALDLEVSDFAGNVYNGVDVPAMIEVSDAWPCCSKDIRFDLHNAGQGEQDVPWVYVHFKNLECGWVVPKNTYAWIDCDPDTGECVIVPAPEPPEGYDQWEEGMQGTGLPKPVTEPEYVAECGGIAGELPDGTLVEVPGIGCCYGDDCQLARHISVTIMVSAVSINGPWTAVDLSKYDDDPADGIIKLNELACEQIELGQLPSCETIYVMISFHLQDIPEEYFDMDYFPIDSKWNDWPTNALQKDAIHFDMAFELLQMRVVDPL